MQIKGKYSWIKHLDFMIIDLFALLISFFLAFYIKFGHLHLNEEWRRYVVIIFLINIIIAFYANPYSGILHRRYYNEIGRTFFTVGCNALCATLIFYFLKIGAEYSRTVVIEMYVFYFFLTVLLKYIWKRLLISGITGKTKKTSLLLISEKNKAEESIHSIYAIDLPLYEIAGIHIITKDCEEGKIPESLIYADERTKKKVPVIGDEYVRFILDNNIDEVVVAAKVDSISLNIYKELIANGISVNFVIESLLGFQTEEQFVSTIGTNKTLRVETFSFSPSQSSYLVIKRVFDFFCGLIGIFVLIPTTMLVKLAYMWSGDHEKIFYRQKRVGLNGKIIKIFKYRSMVPNAGEILEELLKDEKYRKEWEEKQKFDNDPRITRVGAFLRRTSIDELPQLINVLLGDMSMVGPRPLVEGELEFHNGLKLYQKVKPGITGWWGCNGRSNIDYRERLELEYYYVKNCSLYLDVLCIIRTVFAVLKKDGAQ